MARENAHGARPRDTDPLRVYAVITLVDHLVQAGRHDAVHELLGKEGPDGPVWYELKQRADDDRGFERDVELAWQLADSQFREAPDDAERVRTIGLQARYALITASLEQLSDRLSPEDLRRHVLNGDWSMSRARLWRPGPRIPPCVRRCLPSSRVSGKTADVRAVVTDALE